MRGQGRKALYEKVGPQGLRGRSSPGDFYISADGLDTYGHSAAAHAPGDRLTHPALFHFQAEVIVYVYVAVYRLGPDVRVDILL
jgi:hypothetical protein